MRGRQRVTGVRVLGALHAGAGAAVEGEARHALLAHQRVVAGGLGAAGGHVLRGPGEGVGRGGGVGQCVGRRRGGSTRALACTDPRSAGRAVAAAAQPTGPAMLHRPRGLTVVHAPVATTRDASAAHLTHLPVAVQPRLRSQSMAVQLRRVWGCGAGGRGVGAGGQGWPTARQGSTSGAHLDSGGQAGRQGARKVTSPRAHSAPMRGGARSRRRRNFPPAPPRPRSHRTQLPAALR